MLIPNIAAMVSKAMEVAQQALSAAQSALTGVTTLQTASEYQPGDSISFNEIAIPGFITTSTTCMYLMFPLDKPISSAVKSITATGKLTIRGVNGYVEGSSGKQFSDYDIYIVRTQSCIGLRLTKGSALEGATNNTPFGAWIQDATFTFN